MLFTILRLYETNRELNTNLEEATGIVVPDTVYRDKPFVPLKNFRNTQLPKTVTVYKSLPTIPISRFVVHTDTVTIYLRDSSKISYSDKFLTQYTRYPKILQLELNDDNLSMELFSTTGTVCQQKYKLNTSKYQYLFDGDILTYKKKPFIKVLDFSVSYQIRPINNLHDLSLGVKYNTSKFNYILGITGFYYPNFKKVPGWDIFFKVEYNF